MATRGTTIANAPLITNPTGTVRMPASDGSGQARSIELDRIADYILDGVDLDTLTGGMTRIDIWTRQTARENILALVSEADQLIVSENMDGACVLYRSYLSGGTLNIRQETPDPTVLYVYGASGTPARGYTYQQGRFDPWALKSEVQAVRDAIPDAIPTDYIDALIYPEWEES